MTPFERATEITLDFEGPGGTLDPDDPGGLTRWGIAQRWHPDTDVANLTRQGATDLLYSDYWRPLRCEAIPWPLAAALFDHGVHSGAPHAAIALQRAVGAAADGKVGPLTLAAVAKRTGTLRGHHLLLLGQQRRRIAELVEENQPKYLVGWMRRVAELGTLCGIELGRTPFDPWAEDPR